MRRKIMILAHQLRAAAATKWGCRQSEILMSECLKISWAYHKSNRAARREERTPLQQLEALATIALTNRRSMTDWERRFVFDNADRLARYGQATKLSPKQIEIINRIYAKAA